MADNQWNECQACDKVSRSRAGWRIFEIFGLGHAICVECSAAPFEETINKLRLFGAKR